VGHPQDAASLFASAQGPKIRDFDRIIETACSHEIDNVANACAIISYDWRAFLQTLRMKAAEIIQQGSEVEPTSFERTNAILLT
jgi:hypothetical protein